MFNKPTNDMARAQLLFAEHVADDWALVTAGTKDSYNTMTIGWGSAGTLWSTPVISVFVHPRRYTHRFLERESHFCVQTFDDKYHRDLAILGSKSGRDQDKVALTSLTPVAYEHTMGFTEARVTLVCRKVYTHHMDLAAVPDEVRKHFSGRGDLYAREAHTVFVGEVVWAEVREG